MISCRIVRKGVADTGGTDPESTNHELVSRKFHTYQGVGHVDVQPLTFLCLTRADH